MGLMGRNANSHVGTVMETVRVITLTEVVRMGVHQDGPGLYAMKVRGLYFFLKQYLQSLHAYIENILILICTITQVTNIHTFDKIFFVDSTLIKNNSCFENKIVLS